MCVEYPLEIVWYSIESIEDFDDEGFDEVESDWVFVCDSVGLYYFEEVEVDSADGEVDHEAEVLVGFVSGFLEADEVVGGTEKLGCSGVGVRGGKRRGRRRRAEVEVEEVLAEIMTPADSFCYICAIELDFHMFLN